MTMNLGQRKLLADIIAGGRAVTRKSLSTVADGKSIKLNELMLRELDSEVPSSAINGFASLVNFLPTSDQPIHRWFRYREGYSVELVKELIKNLPRGSLILDPFCGAGSTLLAAQELGFPSMGIDVNPISTLVSKVKTTKLDQIAQQELLRQIERLKNATIKLTADKKPALRIIDKIFDHQILHSLLVFRRMIKEIELTLAQVWISGTKRSLRNFCALSCVKTLGFNENENYSPGNKWGK